MASFEGYVPIGLFLEKFSKVRRELRFLQIILLHKSCLMKVSVELDSVKLCWSIDLFGIVS